MRVTDFIMRRLVEHGVRQVFMVSGGGAMHLDDSLGLCKDLRYLCNHHEQACAIGAEGYARLSGKLGVCIVTSGPGGTNTLTGVAGQWTDSVPVLYLSGQIKYETSVESCRQLGLRQLGDQEINIVDIVRPITKFAAMVTDPRQVKRMIDKAIHLATSGRPGPVWLDIPLNVQGALIDERSLPGYNPREDPPAASRRAAARGAEEFLRLLAKSERPILAAGHGIRIAGAQKLLLRVVERLGIPVVSTFNGVDLVPSNHPHAIGRIGTIGDRAGNFALQNADLYLSVGSRNNIRQVSYNWRAYARAAVKVVVDIDPAELCKPTLVPDLPVCADAGVFLEELDKRLDDSGYPRFVNWLRWCRARRKRYPVVLPECRRGTGPVTLYEFIETLTNSLAPGSIVVAGNGSACVGLFQAAIVKKRQRLIWNSGYATMGYDLPAAIGVCLAADRGPVVCLAGDGSLQMNIQELETIVFQRLPIKIFYLNNGGYISQKQTQQSFFDGRLVGSDPSSGVGFPDIVKVARAYGLATRRLASRRRLRTTLAAALAAPGPLLCEVLLPHDYRFAPKLASERKPDGRLVSKPLEDLYPFLDRKEFLENMIIPPLPEE